MRDFGFCETLLTRKFTNLESLSKNTLQKFITLIAPEVESDIAKMLPEKFGIIFYGWFHQGTHYVGVFDLYEAMKIPASLEFLCLQIAPLLNDEYFGAESHIDYLDATLSVYRNSRENVIFLVGDIDPENIKLSNLMSLPIIGCASHRMNLAVKSHLQDFENLLEKIHPLMKKLSSVQNRNSFLTHIFAITLVCKIICTRMPKLSTTELLNVEMCASTSILTCQQMKKRAFKSLRNRMKLSLKPKTRMPKRR